MYLEISNGEKVFTRDKTAHDFIKIKWRSKTFIFIIKKDKCIWLLER